MKKNKSVNKSMICVGLFMIFMVSVVFLFGRKGTMSIVMTDDFDGEVDFEVFRCDDLDDANAANQMNKWCLIEGELVTDKSVPVSDDAFAYMKYNTETLQLLIDTASEIGTSQKRISTIKLPIGIYYFASGGYNVSRYYADSRKEENVVINLKDNVRLIGEGIDENGKNTTLKPYSKPQNASITKDECYNDYENCVYHGLDMFYYNDYIDYMDRDHYNEENGPYLKNVSFKSFIIDGNNVNEVFHSSAGKGFMINLCKNCHWDNIVVKNTAATGFGMDSLINNSITNSKAINCGRRAREWASSHDDFDLRTANGGSGFGIGIGYSNAESAYIENCEAIDNTKYGFFFEHQGRFTSNYLSKKNQGYVVINSVAENNMYNYGGERANDSVVIDSKSIDGEDTIAGVMFKNQSRRVNVVNMDVDMSFTDIRPSAYYKDAVIWALANGMIIKDDATLQDKITFNPDDSVTRADALMMLWRMAGMPGDVLYYSPTYAEGSETCGVGGLNVSGSKNVSCIVTGFNDVATDAYYVGAVKWGVDNNIIYGNTSNTFNPGGSIKTNSFIYLLYRYHNSLAGNTGNDDESWEWANSVGLFNGFSDEYKVELFSSSHVLSKSEIVQILYNYSKAKNVNFPINYLLMSDDEHMTLFSNILFYTSGNTLVLDEPAMNGYKFTGWIGSNGMSPSSVTVSSEDRGNKVYIATYQKENTYKVFYNGNGATDEKYDDNNSCLENRLCGLDRYSNNSVFNSTTNTFENSRNYEYGSFYSLVDNYFVKDGYTFIGWATSSNGEKKFDDEDEFSNNDFNNIDNGVVTLYALWKKNETEVSTNYSLSYDCKENGGIYDDTHDIFTVEKNAGASVDLSNVCKKDGYVFVGWNTNKDATSKINSYEMPNNDVTLYGIYKKEAITLKAKFDGNGILSDNDLGEKTCTIPEVFNKNEQGSTCTLYAPLISNAGYTVLGWSVSGDARESDEEYNLNTNKLTLNTVDDEFGRRWYLVAFANRYKVTFNPSGGTLNGSDDLYVQYNSNKLYQRNIDGGYGVLPTVNKDTYDFSGWYTSTNMKVIDADGTLISSVEGYTNEIGNWVVTEDITLYAQFEGDDEEPTEYIVDFTNLTDFGIDNGILILPRMNSDSLISDVVSNGDLSIVDKKDNILVDKKDNILTDSIKLRTGYKLRATFTTRVIEYKISILGDVLSTGELSRDNAKEIAKHVIDKNVLKEREYLLAADYNKDEKIKMNDVMKILRDMKKQENP